MPDNSGSSRHAVACSTHIGRTHQKNQDSGGAWTWTRPDGILASLVVVADGVSAGPTSERASQLASQLIHDCLGGPLMDAELDIAGLRDLLAASAKEASRQIASGERVLVASADATTLAAAVCVGHQAAGVWCGDSRVYRISPTETVRLTRDHSWAEGVVSHGLLTPEQAARDPRAHMITRWLGPQEEAGPVIDTFQIGLEPGDILLCCTDGLYAYLTPPHGRDQDFNLLLAAGEGDLQTRLDLLVHTALSRGGHDDITGAALQIVT